MTTAFVLGNGISRKEINLTMLSTLGQTYGCNALYRDFAPDVLVATDKPISEEIQRSGYALKHKFYTRRPMAGHGAETIPTDIWGYSSGPVAVSLAAQDNNQLIYLIGFDLGPAQSGLFNNVYADTEFYKTSASNPTFTGNWINQLIAIAKKFPNTSFIRVQGSTTADVAKFSTVSNITHMPIEQLKNLHK